MSVAKAVIHRSLALLGLRMSRIPRLTPEREPRYFNLDGMTSAEQNSVEIYDRFYGDSEELDHYYNVQKYADIRRKEFYRIIAEYTAVRVSLNGVDILDVGCGTGHLLTAITERSKPASLSGCDFSPVAMGVATKMFPRASFFTHNIYDALPGAYDVIFCTEVLEHLERPYVALANLMNSLRPGGAAVLTVPNGRLDNLMEHINFWSPEGWGVFLRRECPECLVETELLIDSACNIGLVRRNG